MNTEERRVYDRQYHANRSPEAKARKQLNQADRKRQIMATVREYKATQGCADCGEKDPIVLEFDHREPVHKAFNVGDVCKNGWGLAKIMVEIQKCDVVCANCHRRRTAKQQGWTV